ARRKGFLQAALLFSAIAGVIGVLGWSAYSNYLQADRYLYIADMNLAQQAWDVTPVQVGHILDLLEDTRNNKARGFEWNYWNRLCHLDLLTLKKDWSGIIYVALSADGRRVVTASSNGWIRVWDTETGKETLENEGPVMFRCVAISSD